MKKIIFILLLMPLAVFALEKPKGSRYDGRIQYVNYNEQDIVLVRASPTVGTQIVFSKDEQILDIASGFSQGWELFQSRNMLYIKPRAIENGSDTVFNPQVNSWDTNLHVATNKYVYAFDLKLLPTDKDGNITKSRAVAYRIHFKYPQEENDKLASKKEKAQLKKLMNKKISPVNWSYTMQIGKNSKSIAPVSAYDDGRFTYLKFDGNKDFPTAFLVSENKSESIIDSHLESSIPNGNIDILVLHKVNPQFVLRLGDAVVGIYNEHYDSVGIPPVDGSTINGVERVIIGNQED